MNGYLGTSGDLSWLYKQYTVSDFINKKGSDRTCRRFFRNPSSDRCPSVYAQLPGNLTLEQIQHCAPDFNGDAQRCLTNAVLSAGHCTQEHQSCVGTGASMCWLSRCLAFPNAGLATCGILGDTPGLASAAVTTRLQFG
jgi:hypothetical protein